MEFEGSRVMARSLSQKGGKCVRKRKETNEEVDTPDWADYIDSLVNNLAFSVRCTA